MWFQNYRIWFCVCVWLLVPGPWDQLRSRGEPWPLQAAEWALWHSRNGWDYCRCQLLSSHRIWVRLLYAQKRDFFEPNGLLCKSPTQLNTKVQTLKVEILWSVCSPLSHIRWNCLASSGVCRTVLFCLSPPFILGQVPMGGIGRRRQAEGQAHVSKVFFRTVSFQRILGRRQLRRAGNERGQVPDLRPRVQGVSLGSLCFSTRKICKCFCFALFYHLEAYIRAI